MLKTSWAWLKSRFEPKPDPDLERWVRWYANRVAERIAARPETFRFDQVATELQVDPTLLEFVADRTYRLFLRRAWADAEVTAGEQRMLGKIAAMVGIAPQRAREIDLYTAKLVFRSMLAETLEDGQIDPNEQARLDRIAQSVGMQLPQFASQFLRDDGRLFIDMIAQSVDADGISDARWSRIIGVGRALGLTEDQMLGCLAPSANALVDDLLDRIAGDSVLDKQELQCIHSLIDRLRLGVDAKRRITRATTRLTIVHQLRDPSIQDLAACLNGCHDGECAAPVFSSTRVTWAELARKLNGATWWEITRAQHANWKYSAGASRTVERSQLSHLSGVARQLRVSADVAGLSGFKASLYFLPIGLLAMHRREFHGFTYDDLAYETVSFVEEGEIPRGAEIIDHTWRYVNKSGGPDARFKDNPRMPVCEYGRIVVPWHSLELQVSDAAIPAQLGRT